MRLSPNLFVAHTYHRSGHFHIKKFELKNFMVLNFCGSQNVFYC